MAVARAGALLTSEMNKLEFRFGRAHFSEALGRCDARARVVVNSRSTSLDGSRERERRTAEKM